MPAEDGDPKRGFHRFITLLDEPAVHIGHALCNPCTAAFDGMTEERGGIVTMDVAVMENEDVTWVLDRVRD